MAEGNPWVTEGSLKEEVGGRVLSPRGRVSRSRRGHRLGTGRGTGRGNISREAFSGQSHWARTCARWEGGGSYCQESNLVPQVASWGQFGRRPANPSSQHPWGSAQRRKKAFSFFLSFFSAAPAARGGSQVLNRWVPGSCAKGISNVGGVSCCARNSESSLMTALRP